MWLDDFNWYLWVRNVRRQTKPWLLPTIDSSYGKKNKAVNGDETAKYRYQIPLPTIEYVRVILSMHSLSCGFSLMHWWFVYYCKRRNAISQKMLTSWEETREDVEVWKLEKKKWEEYKRASSGCKTTCEYKGY